MSSSPAVAVAVSDPGGDSGQGEPKQELRPEAVDAAGASPGPAGGSDVTMTEASEEVAAVAEVKVEGAVVLAGDAAVMAGVVREGGDVAAAFDPLYMTESADMVSEEGCEDESVDELRDVAREGGDVAAATDPLYATESAGMVSAEGCGNESTDEAWGLHGGDSDQKLEAEAGALMGEVERKPVPAGDVAAAGEVVEAPSSATTEHAEAESSELEGNYVSATAVVGNKGKDNGVAHCNEEMNNGPANFVQCARYCLPCLDKDGFRVSDLVWGKVKSHPWWPGEIFDPLDASELALKHQRKGNRLVAYFGDNSFAWCDESQLKPFVTNYSQMEKQSSSDAFVSSVNYALEELSRRILSGMSCSCLPEELSDNGMSYMVENAGLKDGVTCSAVNRSEILACFSPESLLHYVKSLALFPGQGGDLLELVIACSQLTSFYRSKGCPELASFQTGSAWVENSMDASSSKNVMVEEPFTSEVQPSDDKPKRGRGRPRKQKPEDDLELIGKKATSSLSNDTAYDVPLERQMVRDFDDFDDLQNKKKRSLDSFEDSETKSSTPTFGSSFKIGECIRRAASQLTGSSSIVKSQNELTVYKNTAEAENAEFDVSSDDAVNELTVEKRAKRRRMHRHHMADPKELLLQLCSVAIEPMNRYNFSAMIISYFSDYRNYVVSTTTEANIVEKSTAKRGRKRRVLPSPDQETTDHMQDSYWSGLSLHNHPIHSLKRAATNTRPRRRRRSSQETDVPSVQHLQTPGPKKQIQVIERSIIHVDEKMVDECKPTALVLSFGRSTALPSETNLIKIFGRYGPLKESETEVQKNTNTVKIAFKKRADAERAFSAAGKYGTFGPSLRSYRLVNMPFSLGLSEANNPDACPGDHGLEVPGPSKSEVSLATVQVNQVDKTDKAKAVKESPGEQVETVKQTCQAEGVKESSGEQVEPFQQTCQPEAAYKPLVDQVDMIKKTGQIDAEQTGRSDQIGIAAHSGQAESIVGESSEQVSTMEQACDRDEVSLKDLSEIVLSGATIGALQVVGVIEQAMEEPLNESAKDVTEADTENEVPEETIVPMELQAQCFTEKPVEQDATEQTTEFQAPKEASAEIPCDLKLEVEALTEESVGQVATEQVKVPMEESAAVLSDAVPADTSEVQGSEVHPETVQFQAVCKTSVEQEGTKAEADTVEDLTEASVQEAGSNKQIAKSKTTVEVAAEQVCCVGQSAQVGDVTGASGGQIDVGKQIAEDVVMAEVMVERPVESKVEAPVEETVENKADAETLGGEAAEGKTTAETPGDNMENTAAAEALSGEAGEGETTTDVPDERTEKATAEALAGETAEGETTAEAPNVETTTAEKTAEDATVKAPDEKNIEAENTIEYAMVEALAENASTAEKTVEDGMVEAPDEKATAAERTVEGAAVEAPDGKATIAEKPGEDATVEAPDEKNTKAENTIEHATVEAPDENATTIEKAVEALDGKATIAKKPVEDATVEAPDEKNTKAENIIEHATVEAPDENATSVEKAVEALDGKDTIAEKPGEDATVEAPDEKNTKAENTIEHATIEAPDENATTAEKTVEAPDGKATIVEKSGEDATVEAPDEKNAKAENTIEHATVEAPDENATTAEKTVEDSMVEAPDEKATLAERTVEGAMVEASDGKAKIAEKPVEDATVAAPDEKATTTEKSIQDATVEAPDEKATTPQRTVEDATIKAPDEKATAAEKTVEDTTVKAPYEKATTAEEDAMVEATDGQAGVTEQTS